MKTLTPTQALALTIPGDFPGVLEGYVGPCEVLHHMDAWVAGAIIHAGSRDAITSYVTGVLPVPLDHLRLPLSSPAVIDHLIRWAANGVRCPACGGTRCQPGAAFDPPNPCEACDESPGYLVAPANLAPFRDIDLPEVTGFPRKALSAALIGVSVRRVAAGLGPIRLILLGPWGQWSGYRWARHDIRDPLTRRPWLGVEYGTEAPGRWHAFAKRDGLFYAHGEEATETAAMGAADRVALASGYALLDIDPTLGPMMRVEVPDV